MKRLVITILAALMLASSLASCSDSGSGGANPSETNDGASVSEEISAVTEELPNYLTLDKSWDGASYRVLGIENTTYPQFTNFEVYSEGENGDIVNDAVYRRNTLIEDKYNVKIELATVNDTNQGSNTEMYQQLTKNIMSGEDACELFFIALRDAGKVITSGYATDINTLPYIDFDQPYWNKTTNEMLSIADKLYLTNSDFSLVDKKRTYILVYNRDMLKAYSDYNLEDLVHAGTWTFDKFTELCKAVSADLNGDGIINNDDQWGCGMDSPNGIIALAVGMGGFLISKDENDFPINDSLKERNVNIAGKLYATLNEDKNNAYYCGQYNNWKYDGYTSVSASSYLFKNGRQLFSTSFPQSLPSYSEVEDLDYGVTLWPKYDENQEQYYTYADRWGSVLFGIPFINQNTELNGFMLEVLSGYSTDTTLQAYYEVSCKVKYTYDETSAEMLDLAFAGLTFDLGTIFNWGEINSKSFSNIMNAKSNSYVSDLEKIKDKINTSIAETIDFVNNLEQ